MKPKVRENLRRTRKLLGLDVPTLAKRVQLSASFLYKIERGERNPGIEDAKRIANALGGRVDELFFDPDLDDLSKDKSLMSTAV